MNLKVLSEHGYKESILGFSLSYNSTIERTKEILRHYAFGVPGENKFLESIILWLDVKAPRFWWQEADTYRLSTKQSESTMHTLMKNGVKPDDFEDKDGTFWYYNSEIFAIINTYILEYKNTKNIDKFLEVKALLPEGFMQRRIWVMSYKTLQNIYNQRHNHKLPQWKYFCEEILNQIEHPEFIRKEI